MKILVSDPLAREGIERLKEEGGFEVTEAINLQKEELISIIAQYHALIVRSETKVTEEVINAATYLRVIARAGTGLDNIDVEAATKKGIIVMNAPEGNTISAAEYTISMMLALSRNIFQAYRSLKEKRWERKKFMGTEVYGKILGVVGLGRIGSEVAKRAQGDTSNYEASLIGKKGTTRHIHIYGSPMLDKDGVYDRSIATIIDLTKKKGK